MWSQPGEALSHLQFFEAYDWGKGCKKSSVCVRMRVCMYCGGGVSTLVYKKVQAKLAVQPRVTSKVTSASLSLPSSTPLYPQVSKVSL